MSKVTYIYSPKPLKLPSYEKKTQLTHPNHLKIYSSADRK